MHKPDKAHIILLVFTCLGIFFVNLDAIYINIMEARNFVTAREMLVDDHWILTTLNGEPRYQKPPLPTWITAISAAAFGMKSMIANRLPAAIMSLILVLTFYKTVLRLGKDQGFAFVASLVLATSFYVIFSGRNGQWDIFTHGFMILATDRIVRLFTDSKRIWTDSLLAGIFIGCSFMSKGPVSLYALWLPFMIAFGWTYRFKGLRKMWLPLLVSTLVAIVLSGWWYAYTYFFDREAVEMITRRETANWTGYNVRPFYYYWSFFTQSGLWTVPAFVGLLFPYLKDKVWDKQLYKFSFIWTIASVVLLSVIPEKKSRYLLPVLIPLALNTAMYLEYLFRRFALVKNPWEKLPVYLHFGIVGSIGFLFPLGGYLLLGDNLDGQWFWFVSLSIALLIIGWMIWKNLLKKNVRGTFYWSIGLIIAVMCLGLPLANTLTVNPEFRSLEELNQWQAENDDLPVYEFGGFTPELIWAYGNPIPVLNKEGTIQIPEERTFGVLIAEENLPDFQNTFGDYQIEKVMRYDMNPKAPGESGHKPRLYRDLYLIRK
ncbi:ArnT family glycosyltransferase [Aureitalea marina]|uniref:ArnT-like N-terminal domain-containing protein n=1 Tax=Aureitalea marina TaxID=930804 RepID=A0A2S7KMI6_9FLAO|nr:glycosyltransferase family 39 protein [Aureitalea marina]PQB03844.1 hypothetical protein BST85_02195 [Aureitalea marina]